MSSRSSIAAPIWPYPTISTDLSASDGRFVASHEARSWARTNSGIPRRLARTSVSVSSAVEVSWMPRPLQSTTPSGTHVAMCSTPAERVCTTFRFGSLAEDLAVGGAEPVRRDVQLDLVGARGQRAVVVEVTVEGLVAQVVGHLAEVREVEGQPDEGIAHATHAPGPSLRGPQRV